MVCSIPSVDKNLFIRPPGFIVRIKAAAPRNVGKTSGMGRSKYMKDDIGTVAVMLAVLAAAGGLTDLVIILVLLVIPACILWPFGE